MYRTMLNLVQKSADSIVAEIKHAIEHDVEFITYHHYAKELRMRCTFHMKNSFMIVGDAVLLAGGNFQNAKDVSRREALKKLILIEQYLMADNLHFDAMTCL